MDTEDGRHAIVVALLLEAGRLMKDTSPEFAPGMSEASEISDQVERLEQIAKDFAALAAAARVLLRPRPLG